MVIAAINRTAKIAVLENGEAIPITNWFEAGGDECDPSDAVTCVAGPCSNGKWYSIDLREYEEVILS